MLRALLINLKQIVWGGGAHRPSIWLGLRLLFSGNWRTFRQQATLNAFYRHDPKEYADWRKRHAITPAMRRQMHERIAGWRNPPLLSVLVAVYAAHETWLRQCIESVRNQIYPHWELCIAANGSAEPHIRRVLQEYAAADARVKVVYHEQVEGGAAASNSALALARGPFIVLLDQDDRIAEHALFRVAQAIMADPAIDMIYSDEDKLAPPDEHGEPFFKPDWSPEYFLACPYAYRLGVYRTDRVRRLGGWRSRYDDARDYDMVLRLVASGVRIHHIPDILYHRRSPSGSVAPGREPKPAEKHGAAEALQSYLELIGRAGRVEDGPADGFYRVRFAIRGDPKVSILIPSACRPIEHRKRRTWLVLECVSSIRRLSTYENIEIIVVDDNHMSDDLAAALAPFRIRRIPFAGPFNYSSKMNLGASAAEGEHLLLLNDDIEVISPDWVQSMLEFSQWPEIGAVGAQLLFPDGTQQHTGVTVLECAPDHSFRHFPGDHPGYHYSSKVHRNWSAVTAACMMTRADVYKELGGFSEQFPSSYNDVDYCLRVLQSQRRIVYTPYAQLYHHESKTRDISAAKAGRYSPEVKNFKKVWEKRFPVDPYYNPNLTPLARDFRIGDTGPDFLS